MKQLSLEVKGLKDNFIVPADAARVVLGSRPSFKPSLKLPSLTVSREHAEIVPQGEDWLYRDLASDNGTWAFPSGERVRERRISHGMTLNVGGVLVRFLLTGSKVVTEPTAPPNVGT